MEIDYADPNLAQLVFDPAFSARLAPEVVTAFRRRIQQIQAAPDERDFRALKSLHFEKLKGKRSHQYSMRLNRQYRLILEFEGSEPSKRVVVVGIEDYH